MLALHPHDYSLVLNLYWDEIVNEADYRASSQVFTADFKFFGPGVPGGTDQKGFYRFIDELHTAFSDKHFEELERASLNDIVVSRFRVTGIHDGVFRGAAPTLKNTNIEGCDIFYFTNGKISMIRAYFDMLEMMRQMDVVKF